MTQYVILQLVWIGFGVGFNLVSYIRMKRGKTPLMQTPPLVGICVLVVFIPAILLGLTGWLVSYVVLNLMIAVFIGYTGIFRHLQALRRDRELKNYASKTALLSGVGINLFGVGVAVLACVAALGLYA